MLYAVFAVIFVIAMPQYTQAQTHVETMEMGYNTLRHGDTTVMETTYPAFANGSRLGARDLHNLAELQQLMLVAQTTYPEDVRRIEAEWNNAAYTEESFASITATELDVMRSKVRVPQDAVLNTTFAGSVLPTKLPAYVDFRQFHVSSTQYIDDHHVSPLLPGGDHGDRAFLAHALDNANSHYSIGMNGLKSLSDADKADLISQIKDLNKGVRGNMPHIIVYNSGFDSSKDGKNFFYEAGNGAPIMGYFFTLQSGLVIFIEDECANVIIPFQMFHARTEMYTRPLAYTAPVGITSTPAPAPQPMPQNVAKGINPWAIIVPLAIVGVAGYFIFHHSGGNGAPKTYGSPTNNSSL